MPGLNAFRSASRKTNQLSFLASARGFDAAVSLGEFLDAPGGIDELLFASEKRMTSGTNTDLNIPPRGTGMIHRPARTNDIGLVILWMDTRFHVRKGARNLLASTHGCKP